MRVMVGVFASALLFMCAHAGPMENLLDNGGFEADLGANGQPPGFRLGPIDSRTKAAGTWEIVSGAHAGAGALKIVRTNTDLGFALNLLLPEDLRRTPGKRYAVVCWVKTVGQPGPSRKERLRIQAFTSEWTGACTTLRATEPNPYLRTWSKMAFLLEEKPGRVLTYLRFLVGAEEAGEGVIIDDVGLYDVTNASQEDVSALFAFEHAGPPAGAVDAHPFSKGNQLDNSSFELGLAGGWSILGTLPSEQRAAVQPAGAWHGDRAVRIDFTAGGLRTLTGKFRRLRTHQTHTLSAWAKAATPGAYVSVSLENGYVPDGGSPHRITERRNLPEGEWTRVSATGVSEPGPAGAYAVRIAAGGSQAGSVLLDAVQLEEGGQTDYAPRSSLETTLWTEEPSAISAWGAPLEYTVQVWNNGDAPAAIRLRTFTADFWGREVASEHINVDAAKTGLTSLTCSRIAPARGSLRVRLYVPGEPEPRDEFTATVVPEPRYPGRNPASRFGQHVRLEPWQLGIAKRMGAGWVRLHDCDHCLNWDSVQPEPDQWVWADEKIDAAHAAGLEILGVLGRAPAWALRDENGVQPERGGWFYPADLDAWEAYAENITRHFKGKVDHWEIWNEPFAFGIGDGAKYARLAERAYPAAKRGNPDSVILGFCTFDLAKTFNETALANGMMDLCDVVSYHCYTRRGTDAYRRGTRVLEVLGVEEAGKPVWMSEGMGGYTATWHSLLLDAVDDPYSRRPGAPILSSEEAAVTGCKAIANILSTGALKTFWYWSPWEGAGSIRPDRYTWFEYDGQLKPYAAAYSVCAHFLDGTHSTGRAERDDSAVACFFERQRQGIAVAWSEADQDISLRLRPKAAKHMSAYDMMGNPLDLAGGADPTLGTHPIFFVSRTGGATELAGMLGF